MSTTFPTFPAAQLPGMPALTLWPEWLPCFYALVEHNKTTENRGWPPPAKYIGGDIVLHAGSKIGGPKGHAGWMERATEEVTGEIVSVYEDMRSIRIGGAFQRRFIPIPLGCLVCVVRLDGADRDQRTPWDMPDAWHWRVSNLRMIEPAVPMVGHQGVWRVPS